MTSPFYSSEQTELSRAVLDEVLAAVPDAILIGGWGTWVRTGGPMSHDIDLILSRADLEVLEGIVDDLSVSRHLSGTKWRATWRSIHLDLYVPHQSRLGTNLQLRTERLAAYQERHGPYRVLSVPAHLATKLAALLDRPDSLPGRKDRTEILTLLPDPAAAATPAVLEEASARSDAERRTLVAKAFEYLAADASLDRAARDRLRRTAKAWLAHSSAAPTPEGGLPRDPPTLGRPDGSRSRRVAAPGSLGSGESQHRGPRPHA